MILRRFYNSITGGLPTIYALSTAGGQKSAVAVIRVSGTHSRYVIDRLTEGRSNIVPRKAHLRKLRSPFDGKLLDAALALYFPGPNSFTGEDMLELQVHGGKAVVKNVLSTIGELHDPQHGIVIRHAERGDFVKRAYQNGKFDLTEVEGIRDLIDAETEMQRIGALSSFQGSNKDLFLEWRRILVDSMAQITALIDFAEDNDDVGSDNSVSIKRNITKLQQDAKKFVNKIDRSNLLKDGINVTILGEPNSGKSSLINAISSDEVSIVTNIPGTTRDSISATIDIKGYKVNIVDTAGIRTGSLDVVENLGIKRAITKGLASHICLIVLDSTKVPLISADLKQCIVDLANKPLVVYVLNKMDLVGLDKRQNTFDQLIEEVASYCNFQPISCTTQEGLESLILNIESQCKQVAEIADDPVIVSQRVREILSVDLLPSLQHFLENKDLVGASEDLQQAIRGLEKVMGVAIGLDEILDSVFSSFCIGK